MNFLKNFRLKVAILSVLLVELLLSSWQVAFQSCFGLIIFSIFIIIILWSSIQIRVQQRVCFRNCYLKEQSFLFNLLTSNKLTILVSIVTSFFIALVVSDVTMKIGIELLIYISIHTFLMSILFISLKNKMKKSTHKVLTTLFAKEIAIKVGSMLMLIAFALDILYNNKVNADFRIYSNCNLIDQILNVNFLINKNIVQVVDTINTWWSWSLYVLYSAIASFGLNRVVMQIVYSVDKAMEQKNEN